MRFARLDLIRFGCFTDVSLELPSNEGRDFHIVIGANEAGKTTTVTAVEDLLFGIPGRTPYAFRHDYAALRLGAVIEQGEQRLEFRRRKGSRDTLLGGGDLPLPGGEGRLLPYLGGVDRNFLARMFNLSHERLARGGREILDAEGEAGRALFTAGSGLMELRQQALNLEKEAESLWAPRKSKQRLYYQAQARLVETERILRDTIRRPKEWKELHKGFEAAEEQTEALHRKFEERVSEMKRLSRIRRVSAAVRRKEALDREIEALGPVIEFPETAAEELEGAVREEETTAAGIEALAEERGRKQEKRRAIERDDALLGRRDAIQELRERRSQILQMRSDLPKRRAELETAMDDLRRLGREAGWESPRASSDAEALDTEALLSRVPSRARVSEVRDLLQRHGALEEAKRGAEEALDAANSRLAGQEAKIEGSVAPVDISRLDAVLAETRGVPDLESAIRSGRKAVAEAEDRIARLRQALRPSVPDETRSEDIGALAALPRAVVQECRDRQRDLGNELREIERRLAEQRRLLDRRRQERTRSAGEERLETRESLDLVRTRRDDLWKRLRRRYLGDDPADQVADREIEAAPPESEERLAEGFEAAAREADLIADRRFDGAAAAGRLAELDRTIRGLEADVEEAAAEEAATKQKIQEMETEWRSRWTDCPFEPDSPAAMLEWLDQRDSIVAILGERQSAAIELDALLAAERRAREQLTAALAASGGEQQAMRDESVRVLMGQVEGLVRGQRERSRRNEEAREALRTARAEQEREASRARKAGEEWGVWRDAWSASLQRIGLDPETSLVSVAAQLDLFDAMREKEARVEELRVKRIGAMERDIGVFESLVEQILGEIAPDFAGLPADEAVRRLGERLDREIDHSKECEALDAETRRISRDIEERERARSEARARVAPLYRKVGSENLADLKEAIARSDDLRKLQAEREQVQEHLREHGDGFGFDELLAECAGMSPDDARAREEAAETQRKATSEQLDDAQRRRADAQSKLESFRGDDAAARLAAERQEALAGMREAAARYTRVRTAAILLRWALNRFRREKQGPMLRRAGELFRELTRGSFAGLEVDFDDRDRRLLYAVRSGSEKLPVSGLSSGSEDQLFLALRVAAVEDYVAQANPLPFVADDLFLNFDPERSAAGFEILGQLALRTQVLFFTHHEHLVEIAREALGAAVPVLRLDRAA